MVRSSAPTPVRCSAYNDITARGRQAILCGGTGLYLDAVIRGYHLPDAPVDPAYRATLEPYSDEELTQRLASYISLHNHTDTETRDRLVRALEIQEVLRLLDDVVPPERLLRFGLEYRHVTRHLLGQCSQDDMFRDLFTDIRRFAKRQMTWFRRMERCGVPIRWIDGSLPLEEKVEIITSSF